MKQCEDHPLNPNPDSQWQSFFKDNEVLLQIDKDVRRLCPDISFFSQPCEFPNEKIASGQYERLHDRVQQTCLRSQNIERKGLGIAKLSLLKKKATENYAPLDAGLEAHWEVVERILFLYAKLNPGQSYVQGMNEIIGPIYYVFASDTNNDWKGIYKQLLYINLLKQTLIHLKFPTQAYFQTIFNISRLIQCISFNHFKN